MSNQQTWTRARPEIQSNSYITEECNTTKTTHPLPRTPAKISQTALQTPCCSTALSDCAEKRSFFQSTPGRKRALNIKFPRSLWCQDCERLILHSLSQRAEALIYLSSKTGRTQAGKVLPTGKVSEGWDSPVIQANYSYNKSISSEFDLGNRAKRYQTISSRSHDFSCT